jgi:hypothetical protein
MSIDPLATLKQQSQITTLIACRRLHPQVNNIVFSDYWC